MNTKRFSFDVFFCMDKAIFFILSTMKAGTWSRSQTERAKLRHRITRSPQSSETRSEYRADTCRHVEKNAGRLSSPLGDATLQFLEQSFRFIPFSKVFIFLQQPLQLLARLIFPPRLGQGFGQMNTNLTDMWRMHGGIPQ